MVAIRRSRLHGNQQIMNKIPNKGHQQLRKGRKSIPGTYYSITLATYNRSHLLTIPGIPNIIYDSFDWLETDKQLKWLCIMVMPDHIHVVFQLGHKKTLSQLIQSFRRFTANQINAHLKQTGTVWQANFYDHGIRHDESLNKIIRYCYENPVRKTLWNVQRIIRIGDVNFRCQIGRRELRFPTTNMSRFGDRSYRR